MEIALKIRNILFKTFLLSFVILVLWHIVYIFNSDFIINVFESVYKISAQEARFSIVIASNAMKIITLFFFLFPAVAIHLEFVKCKCEHKD